ncbi:MAG: hypothetical protein K0R90_725 [Oscillospiraceae bacterium]|jgi:hypothetical protein|nr:hypothetical protein [Oscillospiraceae bacterium]
MPYVIFAFLVIALIDFLPLIKQKKYKELFCVGAFFITGVVLSILYVSGVVIPSPMVLLGDFLKKVLHLSY